MEDLYNPSKNSSRLISAPSRSTLAQQKGFNPLEEKTRENMSLHNELRLTRQLCDAVIRVDGAEFSVHKLVLCKCSPYFRALFSRWSTPACATFDIPGVTPYQMCFIIDFAYTGYVPLTNENAEELFIMADHFGISGLLQACSDFLEKHLSPLNCIQIWKLTYTFYHPELRDKAFLYLLRHFEEVVSTCGDFLLLSAQSLAEIVGSYQLIVKREEIVYEAILKWMNYAPEERKEHSSLLFPKVRLAWMSPKYLRENVNEREFVESIPELQPRVPPALMLAIGGWTERGPTSLIEAYESNTEYWKHAPMTTETPLICHGSVFLNGSVYLVGGCVNQFNAVHRFDLASMTWHEASPMHSKRCFVSVTVTNGFIYAMGGCDVHERLNTVERYDPRSNQWTLVSSMHEKRSGASCTTLNGRVYVCGGFNGSQFLSTAEVYNPDTDQWTMIANMSSKRSGLGVAAFGEYIFAVGGFDGVSRLNTVEAYNVSTKTWCKIPSMKKKRSNFGISVMEDLLFAVGGFDGVSTISDVEFYDIKANMWVKANSMKMSRSHLSCCVVDRLYNTAYYADHPNSPQLNHLPSDKEEETEQ
ncbi:kelch-like protein 10 [Cyprinodon tularosa]|uniref:kelch-like protein 10 n=1 Tax=Cyprinodon tularosa TaxID=77115 RepID=UPI0018E20C1F|nr:kelch-like protein 10 [Cyprinodon tularosa]